MGILIRILITALLVMVIAYFMPGVVVDSYVTAIIVAIVLGLLNIFIKPLLILLTLPVTIITFGLFLLVINALIILLCTELVTGFEVRSFWIALLFSMVLSLLQSVIFSVSGQKD